MEGGHPAQQRRVLEGLLGRCLDLFNQPAGEGEDQGVGTEKDYENNNDYIGPESKPVTNDDERPIKKDTVNKNPAKNNEDIKPIGSPVEEPKKKKGLFQRIFGKKNKN